MCHKLGEFVKKNMKIICVLFLFLIISVYADDSRKSTKRSILGESILAHSLGTLDHGIDLHDGGIWTDSSLSGHYGLSGGLLATHNHHVVSALSSGIGPINLGSHTDRTVYLTRKIGLPIPQPYPVHIETKVPVAVPHPVPVPVDRPYPVPVPKPYPVHIEKPVPVPVDRPVPYPVKVFVKVPVPVPFKVAVPHPVPVKVTQPFPVPIPQPVLVKQAVPALASSHSFSSYDDHFPSIWKKW